MPAPKKTAQTKAAKTNSSESAPVVKSAINKSAKTGKIVSEKFAEQHPATTFKQRVERPIAGAALKQIQRAAKKAVKTVERARDPDRGIAAGAAQMADGIKKAVGAAVKSSEKKTSKSAGKKSTAPAKKAAPKKRAAGKSMTSSTKKTGTKTAERSRRSLVSRPKAPASSRPRRVAEESVLEVPVLHGEIVDRLPESRSPAPTRPALPAASAYRTDTAPFKSGSSLRPSAPRSSVVSEPSPSRPSAFNVEAVREVLERSTDAHDNLRNQARSLFGDK